MAVNDERANRVAAAARQILLPDVLAVEDLAPVLHLRPSAIRALIRRGAIPARKLGRRWLVTRAELLRALSCPAAGWRAVPPGGRP